MAMQIEDISRMIREAIPDAEVSITDVAGDGDHYSVRVISGHFSGKSRIQQHREVYEALQGKVGSELHALIIQTGTGK